MHKKILHKLIYLFSGEFVSAILFAVLWAIYIQTIEWTTPYLTSPVSLYFFFILEVILLQGSYYWFLKWRQVRKKNFSNLPDQKLRLFSFFKTSNLLFIAVGIPFIIYQFAVAAVDAYWSLFIYLFAIIEHINYYHIRLSYLSLEEIKEFIRQKGFRKSKLAKEIEVFKGRIG